MPKITSKWQRCGELTAATLYELLRFRQQIFVVEQASPYPDLDGLDTTAWHFVLHAEHGLVGCLRLTTPDDGETAVRIGRVAVRVELRRRGLGRRLVTEALLFSRERYPERGIALAAQLSLVPFYEGFGFAAVSAPYDDFGVAHVEMALHTIAV